MTCITADVARKQSDYMLKAMSENKSCSKCAAIAINERTRRAIAKLYNCPHHILFGVEEMTKPEEQRVSKKTNVRTSHDLSFLVKGPSGELGSTVYKDLDSHTLHEILDYAGEVKISRVYVK